MSTQTVRRHKRQGIALSIRISIGLVCAAIIPLLLIFIFISAQTIPALIDQANQTLTNDARAHVQLIDTYFSERVLDVLTVGQEASQLSQIQRLFTIDQLNPAQFQADVTSAGYPLLIGGSVRDKNYADWALFTKTGQLVLFYPPQNQPQPHGQSLIPPKELAAANSGNIFVSPVYYSPSTRKASMDIYVPVVAGLPQALPRTGVQPSLQLHSPSQTEVIGILRATLNLDYIWNIVQQDFNRNGSGSYAFIVDENGVRIADTGVRRRFTAIAPLKPAVQQSMSKEARYGTTSSVPVLADSAIANSFKKGSQVNTLQAQPTGQHELFQIVRQATSNPYFHWNYFVLSPLSVETTAARQQQLNIALIALVATSGVVIIGLYVGRAISRPILRAVEYLHGDSRALNGLATSQEEIASQQMWVIDASQIGLESVQYYTQATRIASSQLHRTMRDLPQLRTEHDFQKVINSLGRIEYVAQYIENASMYQDSSNQKLTAALKLSTQVTEQLHQGATSASEAAIKLEQVVSDLHAIVGQ